MARTLQSLAVIVLGMAVMGAAPRARAAARSAGAEPPATVLLYNDAGVPVPVLTSAEKEAERIFRAAGVETRWLNCRAGNATGADCRQIWGSDVFVMHIVDMHGGGAGFKNDIFGMAFLTPGSPGKYCDLFYDRIERMHQDSHASLPRLLAHVAAHELGHLLLGSNSHAAMGIMSPLWQERELRQLGMGALLFTPQQAVRMRQTIAAKTEKPALSR